MANLVSDIETINLAMLDVDGHHCQKHSETSRRLCLETINGNGMDGYCFMMNYAYPVFIQGNYRKYSILEYIQTYEVEQSIKNPFTI